MEIKLLTTGWFKRYTNGEKEIKLIVADGCTLISAVAAAGIPDEEFGFAVVNGVKTNAGHVLKNGDEVQLFPLIIGG